jgi:hypothetical protein
MNPKQLATLERFDTSLSFVLIVPSVQPAVTTMTKMASAAIGLCGRRVPESRPAATSAGQTI